MNWIELLLRPLDMLLSIFATNTATQGSVMNVHVGLDRFAYTPRRPKLTPAFDCTVARSASRLEPYTVCLALRERARSALAPHRAFASLRRASPVCRGIAMAGRRAPARRVSHLYAASRRYLACRLATLTVSRPIAVLACCRSRDWTTRGVCTARTALVPRAPALRQRRAYSTRQASCSRCPAPSRLVNWTGLTPSTLPSCRARGARGIAVAAWNSYVNHAEIRRSLATDPSRAAGIL